MIHERWPLFRSIAWLVLLATGLPGIVRSEVSADPTPTGVNPIIFAQIVDGGDPIGPGVWRQFRSTNGEMRVLNSHGYARGDGRPDLATLPSGAPLAVWAYNNGSESDIVVAEWTGADWSPIASISTAAANELDPRVCVTPEGGVHVVWWEDGASDRVLLSSRSTGSSTWSLPVQVNPAGEAASRPSVVAEAGQIKVAYERQAATPGTGQEVVLAARQPNGSFAFEVVATTTRTGPLDPIVNLVRGRLWVDWMEDGRSFGCSRWTGTIWEPSTVVPWPDGTWLGIEDMRRVVRRSVLAIQ